MNIIFTGLIFLMITILHIIAFIFIIKNFLQIDEANEVSAKKIPEITVTKNISEIINCVVILLSFYATYLGLLLIASHGLFDIGIPFSNHSLFLNRTIYICNFIKGLILIESAIFLPYRLNLLLYKLWYKKTGLSKRIMLPSIIIGIINFILCVFWIIVEGYINDWATWPWEW